MNEQSLKDQAKAWLDGYRLSFVEPAIGSTVGMADMLMTDPETGWQIPIELKLAEPMHRDSLPYLMARPGVPRYDLAMANGTFNCADYIENPPDVLRPTRLRPRQIEWHDSLQRAGGRSFILFGGLRSAGWSAWLLGDCRLEVLRNWRDGIATKLMTRVVTDGKFDGKAWWRGIAGT